VLTGYFLQELTKTFKPLNVPEVIAAKTVEFWGHTKRLPNASIDQYYDCFHKLLDDLQDADEPISARSAFRQFIFTLGSEFESIQNNYRVKFLPSDWYSDDWPTILALCRDYYNSVKPQGLSQRDSSSELSGDRLAYQKKVKEWWLNPVKYCQLIEAEQKKHPGKCLFHLTKSHQTSNCAVKKECDQIVASKSNNASSVSGSLATSGQLCHLTEDSSEEIVEESVDLTAEEQSNVTNDDVLHYFACITNHYLHLIKSNPSLDSRCKMKYPIIADSGANYHIFREVEFFESLTPTSGKVVWGDGKTALDIKGIGTIKLSIDNNIISIDNVRCIPDLAESIYSLLLQIKFQDHGLHSSFEDGLNIIFPTFQTKVILGNDGIYLNAVPSLDSTKAADCSFIRKISSPGTCCHITQTNSAVSLPPDKADHILHNLHDYYQAVKTKRQLCLEVPAGFRQETTSQKEHRHHILQTSNTVDSPDPILSDTNLEDSSSSNSTSPSIEPSILPQDEEYFLRPPLDCPRSTPGQVWHLLCSIYGLKRAPKL